MNNYSYTYWAPGVSTPGIGNVNADEFAFTETHVLFLTKNDSGTSTIALAIPTTLQPIIRFAGPAQ